MSKEMSQEKQEIQSITVYKTRIWKQSTQIYAGQNLTERNMQGSGLHVSELTHIT